MRRVTGYGGRLVIDAPSAVGAEIARAGGPESSSASSLASGPASRPALEAGQVHELLAAEADGVPRAMAVWLARAGTPGGAAKDGARDGARDGAGRAAAASAAGVTKPATADARAGAVVWCDPEGHLYPPAMRAAGLSLDRVYLLRPKSHAETVWALAECLGCRGVSVVIAAPGRLTAVEARRLQLAAERGGGVGILLRRPGDTPHAARTRWLVRPAPGDALTQRWRLRRVHGHGRPTEDIVVEVNRETHHVRTADVLADRPGQTASADTAG